MVFQRPQHLLTRAAKDRRVIYVEEPQFDVAYSCLEATRDPSGVIVLTPHAPAEPGMTAVQAMIDFFLSGWDLNELVTWYYSPMALRFSAHLRPAAVVYDCMDELSHSLYMAKRALHPNIHEFPSSVDVEHTSAGRAG